MCLNLKKQIGYKVLRCNFTSPMYTFQWPESGWMEDDRGELTMSEIRAGAISYGLHLFTDLKSAMAFSTLCEIIVECEYYSVIGFGDAEVVVDRCKVTKVVHGEFLIGHYGKTLQELEKLDGWDQHVKDREALID